MLKLLFQAMSERRFAMADNPDSQEYTTDASWSMQDEEYNDI